MNDKALKHAYCIIAHNEPEVLEVLLEMIDDERNDIYLLIDSKTDISIYHDLKVYKSNLFYVPRLDIRWGDISQVEAEFLLFGTAYKQKYSYYHLLSGVDLPLKSQDYIHDFFSENAGKEFVGFAYTEENAKDLYWKTSRYHILCRYLKNGNKFADCFFKYIRCSFLLIQKMFSFERKYDLELKKGVNWVSITHEFCGYLLSKKDYVLKHFRYIPCVDEIFLQTILWNSSFKSNVFDITKDFGSCLREIDWERGNPYIWKEEDFSYLIKSDNLFARKFSSVDKRIVLMLRDFILDRNAN